MTPADLVVGAVGIALVAGELWRFLGPKKRVPRSAPSRGGGVQEIRVVVRNGFEPDTVVVEVGRPVRLLFFRDETVPESERVVLDAFGIDQPLPPFTTTPVLFTPAEPGDYRFRGGTAALEGRVVAEVGRESARQNLGRGHAKHG